MKTKDSFTILILFKFEIVEKLNSKLFLIYIKNFKLSIEKFKNLNLKYTENESPIFLSYFESTST